MERLATGGQSRHFLQVITLPEVEPPALLAMGALSMVSHRRVPEVPHAGTLVMGDFLHRILVADDDHDTADLAAHLLGLAGHEVRAVYDGQQAIEAARTFRPHVIILDIDMPRMDGCKAARALRADDANASVLLIAHTALTTSADLDRILRAGFDRYLPKPKPAAASSLETLVAKWVSRQWGVPKGIRDVPT